ncbi:hypothetical protein AA957_27720 [Pseudomonas trivialis]|uniref:Lipoprotein n=2 Tax=Pseudomonas trivialis TaxID=200450 RepID=A0A0H5AF61_9PSED|nr:hypothetical protein AA957_27720 [Pseudomonas trivialis]
MLSKLLFSRSLVRPGSNVVLVGAFFALVLTGCSLMEPHAQASWEVDSDVSSREVISCAQETVQALSSKNPRWAKTITRLDFNGSVLETADYSETNITGLRARVVFAAQKHRVALDIKASGPYYKDLGAQAGVVNFRDGMQACLSK